MRICVERGHRHLANVVAELEQDIRRYWDRAEIDSKRAVTPRRCVSALLDPAVACLVIHRLAHWARANRMPLLPGLLAACNRLVFKTTISPASCVAGGWSIRHPAGLHFHAVAGRDLTLYAYATCTADDVPVGGGLARAPTIGDRVHLGADAAIIGPVEIGDDVEISFRAMVTMDVATGSKVLTDASRVRVQRRSHAGSAGLSRAGK
ncbi:MAG: hypothetical protein HYX63_09590 [Gammaproteobacteria bacterium]|nr:hypothetical protein [Gammaproteobacteria bacterium]